MMPDFINLLPKQGFAYYGVPMCLVQPSNDYFLRLQTDVSWRQDPIQLFGKKILQPRLTAWYGDEGLDYRYSGLKMQPLMWNSLLLEIKQLVTGLTGYSFNSALLNLYRDGNDSMGWHRDNERELGREPVIASVSFGAERKFSFRHRMDKSCKVDIILSNGSLLLMRGETQNYWYHCLPKARKIHQPRINITFRTIFK